jgi:hypothetical protein
MARLMFNGTRLRFGHDRLCHEGPRHGHKTQLNRIYVGKTPPSQTAVPIIPSSSIRIISGRWFHLSVRLLAQSSDLNVCPLIPDSAVWSFCCRVSSSSWISPTTSRRDDTIVIIVSTQILPILNPLVYLMQKQAHPLSILASPRHHPTNKSLIFSGYRRDASCLC